MPLNSWQFVLKKSSKIKICSKFKHIIRQLNLGLGSFTWSKSYCAECTESSSLFSIKKSLKNISLPCWILSVSSGWNLNKSSSSSETLSWIGVCTSHSTYIMRLYIIFDVNFKFCKQLLGNINSLIRPSMFKLTKSRFKIHFSSRKYAINFFNFCFDSSELLFWPNFCLAF